VSAASLLRSLTACKGEKLEQRGKQKKNKNKKKRQCRVYGNELRGKQAARRHTQTETHTTHLGKLSASLLVRGLGLGMLVTNGRDLLLHLLDPLLQPCHRSLWHTQHTHTYTSSELSVSDFKTVFSTWNTKTKQPKKPKWKGETKETYANLVGCGATNTIALGSGARRTFNPETRAKQEKKQKEKKRRQTLWAAAPPTRSPSAAARDACCAEYSSDCGGKKECEWVSE
jgi:flagellar biosynthesis/type III secretory pathway M-ring protein FliF/YscJ